MRLFPQRGKKRDHYLCCSAIIQMRNESFRPLFLEAGTRKDRSITDRSRSRIFRFHRISSASPGTRRGSRSRASSIYREALWLLVALGLRAHARANVRPWRAARNICDTASRSIDNSLCSRRNSCARATVR